MEKKYVLNILELSFNLLAKQNCSIFNTVRDLTGTLSCHDI